MAASLMILLLLYSMPTSGQTVKGRVMDAHNNLPVPYAHIQRIGSHEGTISDSLGYFHIEFKLGSELQFSSVGYQTHTYDNINPEVEMVVYLIQDVYLLDGVSVASTRANLLERDRKETLKIAGLPVLANPKPIKPGVWKWNKFNFKTGEAGGTFYGPITYFSNPEKQDRKLGKELADEHTRKINSDLVYKNEIRQNICETYSLSQHEYDSLLIIFNQTYYPNGDDRNAANQLFMFFDKNQP